MNSLTLALLPLFLLTGVLNAASQSVLDRARLQYESAAYEEALSTLTEAEETAAPDKVQLEQYRAFCLIALGRLPEAEHALSALVAADPTYMPSPSVASPKVLTMVSDIRKKELPAIVRNLMAQGRSSYQQKELERARQLFEQVLQLVEDPSMSGRAEVEDIKVVARGFVDLAVAAAAPPPAPVATQASAPPSVPAVPVPPVESIVFVPAVVLQQNMPPWEPPTRAFGTVEYNGSIKVRVGTDGKVKAATIERPSHPAYDGRLLQATQTWLYQPATRNGVPVESERVIAVQLRPIY
jgi:hypothetical protein